MTISSRERRLLVLGGASLVAFLTINYGVVPAILDQVQVRSEYREKIEALERFQLVVDGKRRYEKKVRGDRNAVQAIATTTVTRGEADVGCGRSPGDAAQGCRGERGDYRQ